MIVVASTFSNNSLSELHMKYFSRTSFRLQHSSSICLTVREHWHLSQSGWLSPESRYLWVTRVLHPASGCYRSCANYKFSDNSGYDCQTGVSTYLVSYVPDNTIGYIGDEFLEVKKPNPTTARPRSSPSGPGPSSTSGSSVHWTTDDRLHDAPSHEESNGYIARQCHHSRGC